MPCSHLNRYGIEHVLAVVKTAFLGVLLAASAAYAQSTSGKVTGYIPYSNNGVQIFFFSVDSNLTGGCNVTARYTITSNSPEFKSVQASVMAAYHSQTPVFLRYSNTCNGWSNAWDMTSMCIGTIAC